MLRTTAIAVAGIAGAAALVVGQAELRQARQEAAVVAAAEESTEQRMRLCLGPARVTLGGEPFAKLAFGGEGCRRHVANLVGFRILRTQTAGTGLGPMSLRPISLGDLPSTIVAAR